MLPDLSPGATLLLMNLWFGAFTLNAWRPVRRPPWAILSFLAGWLTCELALHHLVFQLGLSFYLIALGAFAEPSGVGGLGIGLASWLTLARLHLRGSLAGVAAEEAFERLAFEPVEARPVRVGHVARPFAMRHREVERSEEVFAEVEG